MSTITFISISAAVMMIIVMLSNITIIVMTAGFMQAQAASERGAQADVVQAAENVQVCSSMCLCFPVCLCAYSCLSLHLYFVHLCICLSSASKACVLLETEAVWSVLCACLMLYANPLKSDWLCCMNCESQTAELKQSISAAV